uniref:XK-related protein n=1 Tax=Oryzias melastigma TaxID=30732 RepID=A0A3B3BK85_ORYME
LHLPNSTYMIYCIGFYLWNEETQWAGLTLGLFLPGTAVQLLSVKWYYDDGDDRRCYLSVIHILHLGIFKRLWDCMKSVLRRQGSVAELGVVVMQQADVAALWVLEALVLTLPQSLLQAYVVVSTDVGITSPGNFSVIMTLPTSVLCSFLLGATSLVLYYRFLHPKSTEISQGASRHHMGSTCIEQGESSFSLGDKSLPPPSSQTHGSFSLSGVAGSLLEHPGNCEGRSNSSCPCYHHHWLLIRLALKTGDLGKINRAYGAGGAAAILDMDDNHQEFKSNDAITITAGGSCDAVSTSESQGRGLAPLSDCKDEFQSISEPTSTEHPDEEEESLEMESPMESPASDFKRSSPEGKSVFGDSPEPYFCPTESSSTLYFSADPQSPSSASNPRLDSLELGGRLNSIPSDPALHRDVRGLMGRVGQRCISTPKLDLGVSDSSVPHLTGPRRQLIMSRRDEEELF